MGEGASAWDSAHLDRVLALAGVFQATALVQNLAREGQLASHPFAVSIDSLFALDAPSTEAVFGSRIGLRVGLETLCRQLDARQDQRDLELARYWVSLLFLERKLIKRGDLLEVIRSGIENSKDAVSEYGLEHDNVMARLADVYKGSVSTLTPRILVSGEPQFLHQPANANRIRALLLAAIRSTILWRQMGGSRWGLLFGRRHIVNAGRDLLGDMTAHGTSGHDGA
ncbi:MAG: high frequency lysogenization protein HflD [Pseudomonadota bacterium]